MNENEFKQCFLFQGCPSRTGSCYSCGPIDDGCPIYRYFKEIFDKSKENTLNKEKEYINIISSALTTDQIKELIQKILAFQKDLWESNSLSAEEPIQWCNEIIELINNNLNFVKILTDFGGRSIEERDKNIKSTRGKCNFCQDHEPGDTLYDHTSWDGGVGYDYINNIQYCPICGKKLKTWKERKEEEFKAKKELNNG